MVLAAIILYIVFQFFVGWYVSRRIKTEDDYLVAGRSLGYGVATMTIFATWFGAETVVGASGEFYGGGTTGGTADLFGYAFCLIGMGLFLAAPLRRMNLTTTADLFRRRYSVTVERIAVLLMVPTSIIWASAQIRAFGQVLSVSSGAEVTTMILLAAAVVILYTTFGGLLADAWTDMVQGAVLIAGLLILFIVVVGDVGAAGFARLTPAQLDPFGDDIGFWGHLENWAIPICGSIMAAELISRVIAAKTPGIARNASLGAGGLYIVIGLIPVAIGLLAIGMMPGVADGEQILPLVAQRYLPGVVYALFAGALISAILSTVDSALLVASGLVSHNLIVPLRPNISERGKVLTARFGVATGGVIACVLALQGTGIDALVEEASSFGSAGIFVVVLFGLFTRFGGPRSGGASLLAGLLSWIVGAYIIALPLPYLVSLICAFLAYVVTALLEKRA